MCLDCASRYVLGIGDDVDYDADAVPWPPITDAMRRLAGRVDALYELSPVGGPLHIAVDDYNLEDSNLDFCERQLGDARHADVSDIAAEILALLRPLSLPERATALALHEGWLVKMVCVGGCGLERDVEERPGWKIVELECEECYRRVHGEPAEGFVGFVDGVVLTVQKLVS